MKLASVKTQKRYATLSLTTRPMSRNFLPKKKKANKSSYVSLSKLTPSRAMHQRLAALIPHYGVRLTLLRWINLSNFSNTAWNP